MKRFGKIIIVTVFLSMAIFFASLSASAEQSVHTTKPYYRTVGWAEFDVAVAGEIDGVVLLDPPDFALDSPRSGQKVTFGFNGRHPRDFVEMKCERSVQFEIVAHMNTAGSIGVGICRQEAQRLSELAPFAGRTSGEMLALIFSKNAKPGQVDRKKIGLVYEKNMGPDGTIIYYFPVVVVGHGFIFAPTAVLVPANKDWAVIVQTDIMNLCGEGRTRRMQTPLCADVKDAVTEIAKRLFIRFRDK